jgi:hypothetical protein
MKGPGETFRLESDLVVAHHQSLGFRGTSLIEFHNGRSIAGFRRRAMSRGDWVRLLGSPLLVVYRVARTLRMSWTRDVPRSAVIAAAPAIAWIQACNSAGEIVGYLTGQGDSPQHLR